jgi:hypothetical protein
MSIGRAESSPCVMYRTTSDDPSTYAKPPRAEATANCARPDDNVAWVQGALPSWKTIQSGAAHVAQLSTTFPTEATGGWTTTLSFVKGAAAAGMPAGVARTVSWYVPFGTVEATDTASTDDVPVSTAGWAATVMPAGIPSTLIARASL